MVQLLFFTNSRQLACGPQCLRALAAQSHIKLSSAVQAATQYEPDGSFLETSNSVSRFPALHTQSIDTIPTRLGLNSTSILLSLRTGTSWCSFSPIRINRCVSFPNVATIDVERKWFVRGRLRIFVRKMVDHSFNAHRFPRRKQAGINRTSDIEE